jgi:hypothetical protein
MTTILLYVMKLYLAAVLIVAALIGTVVIIPASLLIMLWVSFKNYYDFDTFIKQ